MKTHSTCLTFETMPDAVVAYCAEYLDRCDQCMLSATNKRNCRIVKEQVPKQWPLNPGDLLRSGTPEPILVVPSPDGSRVAICYPPTTNTNEGRLDLWDVADGKLGSVPLIVGNLSDILPKPAFSPDSQILLIGPMELSSGTVRMVSFSKSGGGVLLCTKHVFAQHALHARCLVKSISFLDSETVTYNVSMELNLKKRKIIFDQSCTPTGFSPPEVIFEANPADLEHFQHRYSNGPLYYTHSASFKGPTSIVHLLMVRECKQFFVYNETHGTQAILTVPGANGSLWTDPAVFSHDGSQLVISFFNEHVEFEQTCHLAVFDCDFESAQPVLEQGQSLSWAQDNENEKSIQFLSSGMILRYVSDETSQHRISLMNLENRQIVSAGWNETTWQLLVGLLGSRDIEESVGTIFST